MWKWIVKFMDGKTTYTTGIIGIILFILQNGCQLDVPGLKADVTTLILSFGLIGLRKAKKK
jgi:hypothetical protein